MGGRRGAGGSTRGAGTAGGRASGRFGAAGNPDESASGLATINSVATGATIDSASVTGPASCGAIAGRVVAGAAGAVEPWCGNGTAPAASAG